MADILTDIGRSWIAGLLANVVTPPASYYIGWGTGAGTAAVADTTLFTEDTTDGRVAATESRVTTTVTNDTAQYTATLTATGSKTITNAGVWDQTDPGGFLIQKSDHAGVPLVSGDSIQYTFKLKVT